ncbi:MAG: M23 family metallopeptidase [Anaerolineales bacterium]|nr:M23 family metallopeptidase [Anaerolineales bacterium]
MVFKPPVGTEEERNSGQIWPPTWVDANPYPSKYKLGKNNWAYHTGADLNMARDADAHAPIYSIGDGVVRYAQLVSKTSWGNLIVINHGIVDGKPLFSRYGHVEDIQVQKGQTVQVGQFIARVGNQFGMFPYHLHFDISTTDQLDKSPTYWPGLDLQSLKHHFVDPQAWLRQSHVLGSLPDVSGTTDTTTNDNKPPRTNTIPVHPTWFVIASQITIYKSPSSSAEKSGTLARGEKISIGTEGAKNENLIWGKIVGGKFNGDWVAIRKSDQSENFLSTNPPQSSGTVSEKTNDNTTINNSQPAPTGSTWFVIAPQVTIFKSPNTTSEKSGTLKRGEKISIGNEGAKNENLIWGRIVSGNNNGNWLAIRKADQSESYLSTNPPQN